MQNNTNQSIVPNETEQPYVLWLASWYPCKLDNWNGDFIQRAAMALSAQIPVHVFYLMKDEHAIITKSQKEETVTIGALTETRLYYHPPKWGIAPLDRFISGFYYTRIGRKWLKKLREKLPEGKPLLVEVGVAMRAGTLALWMKRKWGQPFHVKEHWTGYYKHLVPVEMQRGPLFWKITRTILKNATAFLADSQHLCEWIQAHYLQIQAWEIPNVVDTGLFYPNHEKPAGRPFRFIHVSTLGHQKNVEGILRAFELFFNKKKDRGVELQLVGPQNKKLLQWVEERQHLRPIIHFTGELPYHEVAKRMRDSDAFILFSRHENLPCVMLEAFCCGLPVIATKVGGIPFHLSADRGILIDSENENQLLDAMESIISEYDAYRRNNISSKAISEYGIEPIGKKYIEIYTKIYPHLFPKKGT